MFDYWQARLIDDIYNKNTKSLEKKIIKLYKQANKTINHQLVKLWIDMLADGEISANTLYRNNRYRALQDTIQKELYELGVAENDNLQLSLLDGFKESYTCTMQGYGINISWGIFNENIAKEIVASNFKGVVYSDRIWSNKDKLRTTIEQKIVDTAITGQDIRKASRELRDRFGVGYSDSERLIRTETMRVLNGAQKQSYVDRGYQKGYYLVARDERLCEFCNQRAAETMTSPEPISTMASVHHPNCRCTIIPVLE